MKPPFSEQSSTNCGGDGSLWFRDEIQLGPQFLGNGEIGDIGHQLKLLFVQARNAAQKLEGAGLGHLKKINCRFSSTNADSTICDMTYLN